MCDPDVTFKMVTDHSGKFHQISIDDVIVGDLVYMIEPEHPRMGVNCVQILEKTSFSLTCIYLSIGTKVSHRISEFINGYIQMYMKKDYYESRKDFLKSRE